MRAGVSREYKSSSPLLSFDRWILSNKEKFPFDFVLPFEISANKKNIGESASKFETRI